MEKSRSEIINKIALVIGEDSNSLTISKISGYVDETLKKELLETAHVLAQINEDLRHRKVSNNILIKQGAMIVEGNIRFILKEYGSKFTGTNNIYTSKADAPQLSGSVHVDGRL